MMGGQPADTKKPLLQLISNVAGSDSVMPTKWLGRTAGGEQ